MCGDKFYFELGKVLFIVKEGIVLSHKISDKGIQVGQAKVEVIAKLTPPIFVKGVRNFFGHVGFHGWFIKDSQRLLQCVSF